MCNNVSGIKLAKNPVCHARTKHLKICHHFVREHLLAGEISIHHVATQDRPANILTKVLPKFKFEQHNNYIGMCSVNDL